MKQLISQAGQCGLQPALLDLLQHIPLLHAADYEQALQLACAAGAHGCIGLFTLHRSRRAFNLWLAAYRTRLPLPSHIAVCVFHQRHHRHVEQLVLFTTAAAAAVAGLDE
jgi:hypothetical protein